MRYGRTEVVTRGYARLHGIMEAGFFVGYQERAVLAKIRQPEGRGYGCRCVTGLSGSRVSPAGFGLRTQPPETRHPWRNSGLPCLPWQGIAGKRGDT